MRITFLDYCLLLCILSQATFSMEKKPLTAQQVCGLLHTQHKNNQSFSPSCPGHFLRQKLISASMSVPEYTSCTALTIATPCIEDAITKKTILAGSLEKEFLYSIYINQNSVFSYFPHWSSDEQQLFNPAVAILQKDHDIVARIVYAISQRKCFGCSKKYILAHVLATNLATDATQDVLHNTKLITILEKVLKEQGVHALTFHGCTTGTTDYIYSSMGYKGFSCDHPCKDDTDAMLATIYPYFAKKL